MNIKAIDHQILNFLQRISVPLARFSLFVIFFWFGLLKVIGESPAGEMVESLFTQTISFMSFPTFMLLFAWFEVLIGILFLIPKATRLVFLLLIIHMITTLGPLIMLPEMTWAGFLIPTMEGQYIIKNLVIIATAIAVAAHVRPMDGDIRK
ncbi:MAG: hypothetical protein V4526_01395 [Patescibacteria group bacterium]